MVERSRRSVGATLAAARAALAEGVAANLAGGTHHASASRGSGYCVFNDVAVASRILQAEAPRLRIVVVDLDVHQGDGTAAIFAGDPSVFTISLHGAKNFPFRKARATSTSPCPTAAATPTTCDALERALAVARAASTRERPFGLAFYLAGADPHEGDRLGRLKLSAAGLLERDRRVLARLGALDIPVALAMAGGYGHDLDVTVAIQAATIEAAIAAWRAWRDRASGRAGGSAVCASCACHRQSRPMTASTDSDRHAQTAANDAGLPAEDRPPRAGAALALPPLRPPGDALDRQRRLRPSQQRRLPEPVRHRRQRRARRRGRARHRARRGDRPGGRDRLPLLLVGRLPAGTRGRPGGRRGSAAPASPTRSASSRPARRRPRRMAASSTSMSIARRAGPCRCPIACSPS